ncbi:NHLP family bacteriocin export ABC transporter peptidase/permease/ATPase subunit [Magnetococcales bacterium HHB-1]
MKRWFSSPCRFWNRTPVILQMEAAECGAASLAMILAYHGCWIPLEELRVLCGVSRDGANALNLLKAARRYGLNARGFRQSTQRLLETAVAPAIIHWNFNHFVVFNGKQGDKISLNDPASGHRLVSLQEFEQSFTGVVLTFTKEKHFKREGSPPRLWKHLHRHLHHARSGMAYVGLASLLLVVPGLMLPALSKVFIDDILIGEQNRWLIPLLIGLGVTALIRALLTALQQRYLLRLESKLAITLSGRYFNHLLKLPAEFFAQRHVGELANRVLANDRVANLLSGELATTLFNLTSVLFYGMVMALFNVELTLLALALGGSNFLLLRFTAKKREALSHHLLNEQGKMVSATVGSIHAIETLKANGAESDAFYRWAGFQANTLLVQQRIGRLNATVQSVGHFTNLLTMAVILGVGGLRILEGEMTIGMLVAFQTLAASFTQPIQALASFAGDLQIIRGDLTRLADLYRYPTPPAPCLLDKPASPLQGQVEIKNIAFGYQPLEPPLIENFSLRLNPGQRIALVGRSGSGKSTIGRLLCGLHTPWSGEILLDHQPLATLPTEVFADGVAYVGQEIFLFEGSIRDNLTLWDSTPSEAQLVQALKDAAIYDEVMARPGALESMVTEGGVNFSGGQCQRLEIARALVNNPSLLVLDEATSALDPITEQRIDHQLRRRGCATLIISHRLSAIRDAHEIIVLDKGKAVERGTHDTLLQESGVYASLVGRSTE